MMKGMQRLGPWLGLLILILASNAARAHAQDYVRITEGDRVGLATPSGQVVIPPKYEALGWSHDTGIHPVEDRIGFRQNGLWGMLNLEGEKITNAQYTTLSPIPGHGFLASDRRQDLRGASFGVIDEDGKVILPLRYFNLEQHGELLIAARWQERELVYGVIDFGHKSILPFEYKHITAIDESLLAVTNPNGKTALFHIKGRWVTGFLYDKLMPFQGPYARILAQGRMGLIDHQGNVVVKPEYRDIRVLSADSVELQHFANWMVLTSNRDTLHTFKADDVWPVAPHSYQLSVGPSDMLWNDSTGIFHLPGYDTDLAPFRDGLATLVTEGKHGAINIYGQTIVPPRYDSLAHVGNYFFAGQSSGDSLLWDVYDQVGFQINQTPLQRILPLQGGRFPVQQLNRWGFMSVKGRISLPCIYDTIPQAFQYGAAIVTFHGEQGIIDTAGAWLRVPEPAELEIISPSLFLRRKGRLTEVRYLENDAVFFRATGTLIPREDGFLVEQEGKLGLKSYAGEWIIQPLYDSLSAPVANKFYAYRKGQEFGVLTLQGEPALRGSEGFQSLYPVEDEFFPVKISGRFGFVDDQGRLRIANRYDSVAAYSEDLAPVKLRGRWGAINRLERIIIQPLYDAPFTFKNGRAVVQRQGNVGIIDVQGQVILSPDSHQITQLPSGRYMVEQDQDFGLLSESGEILLQTRYAYLEDLGNESVIVQRRGKYGLLTPRGRDLLPTLYGQLKYDPLNEAYLAMTPGEVEIRVLGK